MAAITIDSTLFQADPWCLSSALALSLITGKSFSLNNYKTVGQSGFSSGEVALIKAAADVGNAVLVGGAIGHNPISIIIPCHRVIGSDGCMTGYAGGIDKKVKLLKIEGVYKDNFSLPKR